jgi:hypothetical protein
MMMEELIQELRQDWFPNVSDAGLDRVIELLDSASPFLIHGSFTGILPMGCLATHIAWHHPLTCDWTTDAGIMWLSRVAKLNPATSRVIRAWDQSSSVDWELRDALLREFRAERDRRQPPPAMVAPLALQTV